MAKGILGLFMGKPKGGSEDGMQDEDENEDTGEVDSELPPGLVEAVSEFRAAESDEDAAAAFQRAIQCCEE